MDTENHNWSPLVYVKKSNTKVYKINLRLRYTRSEEVEISLR